MSDISRIVCPDPDAQAVALSIFAECGTWALAWPTVRRFVPRKTVWAWRLALVTAVARGLFNA